MQAYGSWLSEGELQKLPAETTSITCYKDHRICIDASAAYNLTAVSGYLSVLTATYDIDRWDSHEITTKPIDYQCSRYTLRVGRENKSVTGLYLRTRSDGTCKNSQPELRLVLGDGMLAQKQILTKQQKLMKEIFQAPDLVLDHP